MPIGNAMTTSARLELVVDSRAASQHLSRLDRELQRLDGRGSAATAMMGKMTLAIGAISAAAGGLGFSRIIRETADFEDAMLGLQAVSGATASQMAEMEKQARTLGATSMFSAEQAGNAQRYLAMAGLEVNEVLSATPGILKLATAGQLDLATAADIASNVLGGMGMEVSELNRVNDVLAATASGANTDIRQLGEALSYAAPFASAAGLSIEETAAAIGAMSDAGIQAGRAGTGLVGILAQLADASPKAQAAIAEANLTMEQLDINARGLQPVLDDLRASNIGSTEALKIFGREAGAAALNVIRASEGVADFTKDLQESEGAAEQMALIIGSGLTGSMRGFNSMMSESILQLGESGLAAGFQSVTDTATGMLAVYNDMLPAFAEANNLTETQTDRIEALAAGVDLLGDAAIIAAGIYTGRFVAGMAAGTASLVSKTAASVADARAEATAAQQTARRTAAELQSANAIRARAIADAKSTAGTNAHAIAMQNLVAASGRATAAQTAHTAATNASVAAMGRASIAARGLSGAMMLVGGPAGAALLAVGAIIYFREELGLTQQAIGYTEEELASLRLEMADMDGVQITQTLSQVEDALMQVGLKAAAAREELAQLRSESGGSGVLGFEGGRVGEEIQGMQAVAEYTEKMTELEQKRAVMQEELTSRTKEGTTAMDDMVVTAERLAAGTGKLTKAQKDAIKEAEQLADNFESLKRTLDPSYSSLMDFWEGIELLNEAIDTTTIEGMTEYNRLVGLLTERYAEATKGSDDTRKKVEQLTQQYDRQYQRGVALTQAISDINAAYRRGDIDGQQYGRMIQGVRDEMAELALEADPMAQEMARAWEEATNRIDETFSDAFAGAFDSFDSFSDQLMDGFKRLLAELAYQATLKPIVVGFTGDMQSMLSGGGGGFSNTISAARGLMGGSSLLGGGSTAAAAGGLYAGANTGAAVGGLYGNVATGGLASTGLTASITSGISAAMPWLAGGALVDNVLGLGIVDGIVSGISGLFGGSPTPFSGRFGTRDSAAPGTFEHQGSDSEQFYQQSAFGSVGFLDAGTERLQRAGTGSKAWAEELAVATAEIDNLTASLAPTAEELAGMRSIVQGLETSSRSASEIVEFALNERPRAALEALGGHFGEFVRGLEGGIEEVVQQAQLGQQSYSILSDSMQRLNLQFDASSAAAYGASSNIATLVGGTENLSTLLSGYYDAFYTEEEKFENLASDLSGTFSEMGRELPTTREGVRNLVESLQLMGAQGQEQLATILQLNQPLNEYITALEEQRRAAEDSTGAVEDNSDALRAQAEIARERESLERQLLGLLGDQAEIRRRDLAGIDESNRSLQQRIWYINDENDVVAEAMRRQEERNQAIERESNAMAQARQQLASFGVSINDWLNNLQGTEQGLGTPADQLAATAQAFDEQYAKAASGDQAARSSITQYADRFIEAQKAWSASGDQTISTIDRVSSLMEKLPDQLTPEQFLADEFRKALGEQTTSLLEGQSLITDRLGNDFASIDLSGEGLIDWNEFYGAFSHLADEETLRQVFGALDNNGSGAIDKLEAISNGTQSLVDYWANQQPAGVQDAIAKITDMYQSALKREPDLPGMQYWIDQFLAGASLQTIEAAIKQHIGSDTGGGSSGGSTGGSMSAVDQWMSGQSSQVKSWAGALENIYSDSHDRAATVADLEYWTGQLSGGKSMGTVNDFIRGAAYMNRYADVRNAWNTDKERWRAESGASNSTEFGIWHAKNLGISEGRQFAEGGYTGPGGKYDPAGIVHAGEVVWSQDDIARFGGVGAVESLRNGGGISMPPLPAFPLLGQSDVTQVLRDMQRTIERQGEQIAELLTEGNKTAKQNRDVNASVGADAKRQRELALRESRDQSRALRLSKQGSL